MTTTIGNENCHLFKSLYTCVRSMYLLYYDMVCFKLWLIVNPSPSDSSSPVLSRRTLWWITRTHHQSGEIIFFNPNPKLWLWASTFLYVLDNFLYTLSYYLQWAKNTAKIVLQHNTFNDNQNRPSYDETDPESDCGYEEGQSPWSPVGNYPALWTPNRLRDRCLV